MARTITLRFPGRCADCGATLEVGTRARWYGRGRVYGFDCHERSGGRRASGGGGGRRLVSTRCEDYPCCGHGPVESGGDGGGCPRVYERADGTSEERFDCAGCGAQLPAKAPSALCAGCRGRSGREFNWAPLERDPDSFFYNPGS